MSFEDLGAAYANNEGMDEVIEDNKESNTEEATEPNTEIENASEEGYDGLKEAYANNEGMDEVIEDNKESNMEEATEPNTEIENASEEGFEVTEDNNKEQTTEAGVEDAESQAEVLSFKEIGKQKWESAFQKVGSFASSMFENGKKAIYTATGIAIEAPNIIEGTKIVAAEMAEEAYGAAKEVYASAVDSVEKKAQEVKANLVERVEKAKTNLLEKLTETKDKYADKATKLTIRGLGWGINKGEQVATKIEETHDKVVKAIENVRIEALKASIEVNTDKAEKHTNKAEKGESKLGELLKGLAEEAGKENGNVTSMGKLLRGVDKLTF